MSFIVWMSMKWLIGVCKGTNSCVDACLLTHATKYLHTLWFRCLMRHEETGIYNATCMQGCSKKGGSDVEEDTSECINFLPMPTFVQNHTHNYCELICKLYARNISVHHFWRDRSKHHSALRYQLLYQIC